MTRTTLLMAVTIALSSSAWADFPRDAERLAGDSRKLADETLSMSEPEPISRAARAMDFESDRLARCAAQFPGVPSSNNPGRLPGCRYELQEMIRAFNSLEYTVSGVLLSRPVALQLDQVRSSVRPFTGYTENPGPGYLRAVGSLDRLGFEFRAYDQGGIYSQCMNFAYYYGLRFVGTVVVNGTWHTAPWGRAWYVSDACRIVASRAY